MCLLERWRSNREKQEIDTRVAQQILCSLPSYRNRVPESLEGLKVKAAGEINNHHPQTANPREK